MEGWYITLNYLLINTNPTLEHHVYNRLSHEEKIIELTPLYHEYDMIAKIQVTNEKKLKHFIQHNIRSIHGVIDTKLLQ